MQIINTQQVRKVPTLEEVINRIDTANQNAIRAAKSAVQVSYNSTWNNPDYTPEQIITALCVKYKATPEELINAHSLLQDVIQASDSTYVRLTMPENANSIQ